MQKILHAIEEESLKYNMILNKGKCAVIVMNGISTITFQNGDPVKQVDLVKYLGVMIHEKAYREPELEYRLSNAKDAAIKLRFFGEKPKFRLYGNSKSIMLWSFHN